MAPTAENIRTAEIAHLDIEHDSAEVDSDFPGMRQEGTTWRLRDLNPAGVSFRYQPSQTAIRATTAGTVWMNRTLRPTVAAP